MTEVKIRQKKDAKQRIFNAAVALFARKGYALVGIREIAKEANVQISMVNYYFDGKIGILKAIMDKFYAKYSEAIDNIGDDKTPLADRVRMVIRNLVTFYRENTELAIAAFSSIPVDIPEIIDYRIKWYESTRKSADRWFKMLGFDPEDAVQMSGLRGFLDNIISGFFRARYCCDRIAKEPKLSEHVKEHFKHDDHAIPMDDEFYNSYVEKLAVMYLEGVKGLLALDKKKGGKNA